MIDIDRCVGCQSCMFACTRRIGDGGLAESRIEVRSAAGMRRGFVVIVCRACTDPPCARVCPTQALVTRDGGGVRLKSERCIGCGHCVEACPLGAVFWDRGQDKPQICIYCGHCVRYCPYDVLAMEEVPRAAG
ncbi:MAG: 4Fe-4S binding protein [Anaerolineae bacterium]